MRRAPSPGRPCAGRYCLGGHAPGAIAWAAMRRAPAYLDMIIELRRAMITTKNLEARDHQPSHQKPMTYT
jgi:hypothetical protein